MQTQRILMSGLWLVIISASAVVAQTKPATPPQTSTAAPASPAAKIGVFVYPRNNQTPQQQSKDENTCYSSALQQTGIDPAAPPPPPQQAPQQKGGAVKGAAKGAAGGAAIGAIADDTDTGTGAAVGATAGAVRGRRQQQKANKQAEQQAKQQSQAQQQQRLDTFRKAFSACIDSKGYSVK